MQDINYAYTVQGWLKGVNTTSGSQGTMIGNGNDCGPGSAVDDLTVEQRLAPYTDYTARTSITFEVGFEIMDADNFEATIDPALSSCGTTVGTAGDNGMGSHGEFDMGQDGLTNSSGTFISNGTNLQTSDAYGFSLNYFNGDYRPLNATVYPFTQMTLPLPADINGIATGAELFNGNIASMAVNIPRLGNGMVYGYRYDQLNRIMRMDGFNGLNNTSNTFTATRTNDYHEEVTYDPNGNIRTYLRNGTTQGGKLLTMDNLTYQYEKASNGQITSNKLRYVHDQVADANYSEDIDSQTSLTLGQVQSENSASVTGDNFQYDEIGNLIKDVKEGISSIEWTVYGKISKITKANSTVIQYTYDASGNRISKDVDGKVTYYVRDASGNVMSIYQYGETSINSGHLSQSEIHLYGSSRIGVYNVSLDVQTCSTTSDPITIFTRGNKFFELTNHLSNVLVTISDKRIAVDANANGTTDYYKPEVITASDYYPGGMQMPGREYVAANNYRFGFNGKENDNDVKGEGNQQDYGMRIYDPRLVRFLSVDPITKKYPELTTYQFASNTPIQAVDLDGKEAFFIHGTASSPQAWTPKLTNLITKTFTNNTHQDATFSWQAESESYFNDEKDRSVAALHLVQHIIDYRKTNNIKDEEITLIGHSHGGNVAIQAAEMLYDKYGVSVNIVNFNTPAWNANTDNRENPAHNPGIFALRHFWTQQDGVAGGLAGDDKYSKDNLITMFDGKNIELIEPLKEGWIKSHFIENINPVELKKHSSEKVPEVPSWKKNPEQSTKPPPSK